MPWVLMVCQIIKAQQQQQRPTEVAKGVGAAVTVLLLMLLPLAMVVGLAMWDHLRVTMSSCALQQWNLRG
jgi:hypothetical protein